MLSIIAKSDNKLGKAPVLLVLGAIIKIIKSLHSHKELFIK
jgi:hypothetical protein